MISRQGEQCPVVIISYMGYSPPKCTCHGNQSHSSKYMILLECLHAQSCDAPSWGSDTNLSHPDSDPTRMAGSNRVRGARLYTGTLIDLFFLKAELVPVGIQTISVITKIIYIDKRTTTIVVSIKIYTHILSLIYLYMYIFY